LATDEEADGGSGQEGVARLVEEPSFLTWKQTETSW
jgi:hypothetical protein